MFAALKRAFVFLWCRSIPLKLSLSTNSLCQLDVLWHDSHSLGVNSSQVGVFEETYEVGLGSFLKSHYSRRLEPKVSLEILGNFSHQTLERQFADQQFGTLLVTTDFTKSHGTRTIPMWLLHSTSSWCRLASSLSRQLFAWSFSSGRLSCSLLCTSHLVRTETKFQIRFSPTEQPFILLTLA